MILLVAAQFAWCLFLWFALRRSRMVSGVKAGHHADWLPAIGFASAATTFLVAIGLLIALNMS